jgi:hypothetical protein
MNLSREAKIVSGIILLVVPTIMYGGLTLLSLRTQGVAGLQPGSLVLTEDQMALWRAGHAHAGVWVLLSLVIQQLVDGARLHGSLAWTARLSAPIAAVLVSGGFFGLAFVPGLRWLLYAGGACLVVSVVLTGVGLLRAVRE